MTKTNKLLAVGKFFLKMMFKVSMGLLKVAVFIFILLSRSLRSTLLQHHFLKGDKSESL